MRIIDPVDLSEIAKRLGVPLNTAQVWSKRRLLPDPVHRMAIGPIWEWRAVRTWAESTGRMPTEDAS